MCVYKCLQGSNYLIIPIYLSIYLFPTCFLISFLGRGFALGSISPRWSDGGGHPRPHHRRAAGRRRGRCLIRLRVKRKSQSAVRLCEDCEIKQSRVKRESQS